MESTSRVISNEEAVALIDARNKELEERSAIFAAQCPTTKKYLVGIKSFLMGERGWIEANNPTVEEVKEQIAFIATRRPIWTDDLQEAEVWDQYYIDQYKQYLPEVEFIKLSLTSTPVFDNVVN